MPSSVLLALLVGVAVLALVPALVRQYDAVETALLDLALPARSSLAGGAIAAGLVQGLPAGLTPPQIRPAGQVLRGAVKNVVDGTAAHLEARTVHQRRRRVLIGLALLVLAQVAGVLVVGPLVWLGLAPSALVLAGYVLRLRALVLATRRRAERRRRVELRRRRRAARLARVAAQAAGADADTETQVARWLSTAPSLRPAPPAQVSAVLAAVGREIVRRSDGTWYPRPVPQSASRPAARPASRPASRPVSRRRYRDGSVVENGAAGAGARADLPGGGFHDLPLKKVVNG